MAQRRGDPLRRLVRPIFITGGLLTSLLLPPLMTPRLARAVTANASFVSQITGPSPFAPNGCGLNTADQGSEYEPDLAVNPTNRRNLVAVWTQDYNLSNVVAASQDGGQHWTQVLVPGLTRCTGGTASGAFDPRVAFGADGTAYVSSAVGDNTSYKLLANRSTDGGLSWSDPVTVDRVGSVAVNAIDFPVLTAAPHRPGTAYLVWSRFHDLLTAPAAPQLFSRTTDGGTTWTSVAEIPITPQPNQTAFASQIRVLPDGTLVDVFIQTPIAVALIGPTGVWAVRSQDQGDSWSAPIFVADIAENAVTDPDSGQGLGRGITFVIPSVAIGPDREVYIVWQLVESATSSRILFVKSFDGGMTWSTPAPLVVEATQAFKPTVAVSPTGLVGVTYFDFRDDASGDQPLTTDLWFRHSDDGGATWLETQVAGPFDIRRAPSPGGFPLGDYFGLIPIGSVGFGAAFVQTIRPQGQGVTNLFFARIEVPPATPTQKPAATPTPANTETATVTPTITPTPTVTPIPSVTPTPTRSPTPTSTVTGTPPTPTPTVRGIVGTGTAASCTDAALNTALAGGGVVTFDCGGPATIDISTGSGTKTIAADTIIDGGELITISGGNSVGVFRVSAGTTLTLHNLTIENGSASGLGGGIYNDNGSLTVTNTTFAGNRANRNGNSGGLGGGIYNESGSVTVTHCTFVLNSVSFGLVHSSGFGGAILNNLGVLTISDSIFANNGADPGVVGAAIANLGGSCTVTQSILRDHSAGAISSSGSLSVTGSTFQNNAGGIGNDGSLTVTNCTYEGNSAFYGGGISNSGSATVTNSTFIGNTASGFNQGEQGNFGGGIYNVDGPLTISNSTFTSNRASSGGSLGAHGGGIYNRSGRLSVTNSTFAYNQAGGDAGSSGGGISSGGLLTITSSTLTGNSASGTNASGAGIFNESVSPALLRNTIVSGNLVAISDSPSANCAGGITDGGHNLDDGTSCGFGTANGSLSGTDPQLDPAGLQNNGGPTQTMALCTGVGVPAGCTAASLAIDAGDKAFCAAELVNNRDQRGFVRPGTGHTQCSIGAYEADATPPEVCIGDCNATGSVTVDEIITLVNVALGTAQPSACGRGVSSGADVNIAVIIQAVNNALTGCASTAQ